MTLAEMHRITWNITSELIESVWFREFNEEQTKAYHRKRNYAPLLIFDSYQNKISIVASTMAHWWVCNRVWEDENQNPK